MSVVFIVVPAVVGGWAGIAAAVGAACAALGYHARRQVEKELEEIAAQPKRESVELEMANAEVIGEALAREEAIKVEKDGVVATFSKDARGRLALHVAGERSRQELAVIGQQLLNRVRQHYACEKVKTELQNRGFVLLQEQVDDNGSIRLSVRRFA